MLSNKEILSKFKINDTVEVTYKTDWGTNFFGIVTGFALNDIDEVCVSIKEIVHYQEEPVIRHMNPNGRVFSVDKVCSSALVSG